MTYTNDRDELMVAAQPRRDHEDVVTLLDRLACAPAPPAWVEIAEVCRLAATTIEHLRSDLAKGSEPMTEQNAESGAPSVHPLDHDAVADFYLDRLTAAGLVVVRVVGDHPLTHGDTLVEATVECTDVGAGYVDVLLDPGPVFRRVEP